MATVGATNSKNPTLVPKGSDFCYGLTIQILIENLNSIKALALFLLQVFLMYYSFNFCCKFALNSLKSIFSFIISYNPFIKCSSVIFRLLRFFNSIIINTFLILFHTHIRQNKCKIPKIGVKSALFGIEKYNISYSHPNSLY